MNRQPTHDDANLILRLYELRREDKMRQARDWFGKNYHARDYEEHVQLCPPGSEPHTFMRMVTSYWDMVASFLTNEVLDKELFYASGQEMLLCWERMRRVMPGLRDATKNPQAFANLEKAAGEFIEWTNRRAPEAHAAFKARIGCADSGAAGR
ncbi:MAG: DUF4760 domain-containing protein [Bryobacteraceae bacterium]